MTALSATNHCHTERWELPTMRTGSAERPGIGLSMLVTLRPAFAERPFDKTEGQVP
jgi:hypothetical protein